MTTKENMMNDYRDPTPEVNLYYVRGITGEYFTTKLAAEVRARKAFPYESEDERYARIFYQRFYMEV